MTRRCLTMLRAALVIVLMPLMVGSCSHRQSADDAGRVVNVYNWASFVDPSVIHDFEEATGLKVNYSTYDSNEQLETLLLTGHTQYDVVVPGGAFFERGLKAQLYERLDRARLHNLANVDPEAARAMRVYDPSGEYGAPYMWLVTVGIAYDAQRVEQRQPGVPPTTWRVFFDAGYLQHFADCGISVIDAPEDVVGAALLSLGRDPNSETLQDLAAAEQLLLRIRPYISQIDSTVYEDSLANRDTCMVLGWGGDVARARQRAKAAGNAYDLRYVIPAEGSVSIVDVLAIPAHAPHPENAHRLIDYLLRQDVSARNSSETFFASPLTEASTRLEPALLQDPAVYPDAQIRKRLVPQRPKGPAFTRALTRVWARFRTGT